MVFYLCTVNIILLYNTYNNFQENKTGNDETISATNAIDAIEKALCLKERTILAHSLRESSQISFVQQFARIAGILSLIINYI